MIKAIIDMSFKFSFIKKRSSLSVFGRSSRKVVLITSSLPPQNYENEKTIKESNKNYYNKINDIGDSVSLGLNLSIKR